MFKLDTDLQVEIDSAVERIVEASHAAAIAAVNRAFGRETKGTARKRRPKARGPRKEPGTRRTSAEVDALAQGLLEAIQANPGQAMSVLAATLGTTPRALQQAVVRLKAHRKIRTTGRRQSTRYFPLSTAPRRERTLR